MEGVGLWGVVIGMIYFLSSSHPLGSFRLLCMLLEITKSSESPLQISNNQSISSLRQSATISNATIARCTAPDPTASSFLQYTDSRKRHQEIFLHNTEAFAS